MRTRPDDANENFPCESAQLEVGSGCDRVDEEQGKAATAHEFTISCTVPSRWRLGAFSFARHGRRAAENLIKVP